MKSLPHSYASEHAKWKNAKLLGYVIAAALFFGMTLLVSFFLVIMAINAIDIPGNIAPNIFVLGLVPSSIGTFLLFTKVFGRFV